MAVFENPDWGWQDIPGARVDMGLEDAEVFVAQRRASRDQEYFRTLVDKRLALYSGYHYGFAGFDADPEYLTREFNALMTYSRQQPADGAAGRADIALVTRSYLGMYLEKNPDQAGQFLVSTRVDQHYRHYALLRRRADQPRTLHRAAGAIAGQGRPGTYLRALPDPGQPSFTG